MGKRFTITIFSFILAFSLVSQSGGFDNNPNRVNPDDPNDTRLRDYTYENAIEPIGQGGYYGGHDTLTNEGMLLKKEVHKSDGDGGEKFKTWADRESLPSLRTGAHDEDSTKVKVPVFAPPPLPPIPIYYQDVWLDERPKSEVRGRCQENQRMLRFCHAETSKT